MMKTMHQKNTSSKWYCVILVPVLLSFECMAQKNSDLSKSIKEYKEFNFAQLMRAQSEFKCPNDTIFFPDDYYATITSRTDSPPLKQFGTNMYAIPLEKFIKYGVNVKDPKAFAKF